jgi:hypothetical protein
MSDNVYREMINQIATPTLISRSMIMGDVNQGVGQYLSTRQVISLTKEETDSIIYSINNNELDAGKYLNSLYEDIEYTDQDDQLYSNLKDGYGISEYFSKYNMYIPNKRYFNYHFSTPESAAMLNVYNGFNTDIPCDLIKEKISSDTREVIPGNFKFPTPKRITYTSFSNTVYNKKNNINIYPLSFPTLCVNLPYEYYSNQFIPENIYTYDLDEKKYVFAGMDSDRFLQIFNGIVNNGIQTPLFIQIRNGNIVSASNEDYLTLLIASYLKIPTIPAVLYILFNTEQNNALAGSDRTSDIAVNTNHYNRIPAIKKTLDIINEVCENKFIFFNQSYYGNIMTDEAVVNGSKINLFKYMGNQDVSKVDASEISYVDFYLVNEFDEDDSGIVIDNVEEHERQVMEETKAEFKKEFDQGIQEFINKCGLNHHSDDTDTETE